MISSRIACFFCRQLLHFSFFHMLRGVFDLFSFYWCCIRRRVRSRGLWHPDDWVEVERLACIEGSDIVREGRGRTTSCLTGFGVEGGSDGFLFWIRKA